MNRQAPPVRAHGTSPHGEHVRRSMTQDGIRIQYAACGAGLAPLYACPDDPHPLVKWASKMLQAPEPEPLPDRECPRCHESWPYPDPEFWQAWRRGDRRGWMNICRSCNADRRHNDRHPAIQK
jgi:hypothetical protein